MEKLFIIKIGGNIIDDDGKLTAFLKLFASIKDKKILVHGGGKAATSIAGRLNIPQQLIEGRRITDGETLKIVTMVYAGLINKTIVSKLQAFGCNCIGLTGADGNLLQAHKRYHPSIDYGFVGDIDAVNHQLIRNIFSQGLAIIVAPITHDRSAQLLNTNADTIAQQIAKTMSSFFEVHLVYSFEKKGVLADLSNEASAIPRIDKKSYESLKDQGVIHSGMIPKIDNAFEAVNSGVRSVIIGRAEELDLMLAGKSGTTVEA